MIVLLQVFVDAQLVMVGGMYVQLGKRSPERSHILIYSSEDDALLTRGDGHGVRGREYAVSRLHAGYDKSEPTWLGTSCTVEV